MNLLELGVAFLAGVATGVVASLADLLYLYIRALCLRFWPDAR